jgi:hypothetical protein
VVIKDIRSETVLKSNGVIYSGKSSRVFQATEHVLAVTEQNRFVSNYISGFTDMYIAAVQKYKIYRFMDRLCGLVVRVLGYRSGGPGSIPGTNRKKKKI